MKSQSLLFALVAAPAVLAHTVFTDFYVNGVTQGDGVAMRMRMDPSTAGSPLEDLSSNDMACNVGGTKGVSRVQSVADGSILTFEIRSWPDDISKPRLDRRHYGPCAVYLKKVSSAINDKGVGDGWFKIWDDGYTASDKRWCTDRVIDNVGLLNVVLPKGLQGGYYLARPEILALHNADKGDPQFYAGCAQIFLESTGDLVPAETVAIPGHVKTGEPSVSVNIYDGDDLTKYTTPGPRVAKLVSGPASASEAQTSQTEGFRPTGCIAENGNWCGTEVPDYSDETGCWASGQKCWDQSEVCYSSAPPTGHAGCDTWQTKCKDIQAQCEAKNFNGPPNKGKDLTPKKETIDVGLIMTTQGGGDVVTSPKTSAVAVESSATTSAEKPKATSVKTDAADAAPTESADNNEAAIPTPLVPVEATITIPASEDAPAPTANPCPHGYDCVYRTHVKTVTAYEYVPVAAMKRRSLHHRRHGLSS